MGGLGLAEQAALYYLSAAAQVAATFAAILAAAGIFTMEWFAKQQDEKEQERRKKYVPHIAGAVNAMAIFAWVCLLILAGLATSPLWLPYWFILLIIATVLIGFWATRRAYHLLQFVLHR